MPRREEVVPWRSTQAAAREPYPRKNVYFVGAQMEEAYDYCIWRSHVDGHTTLEGKRARGVSSLILDLITRNYLDVMLEPGKLDAFTAWRTSAFRADVLSPAPQPLLLAVRKILRLIPKRSEFVGPLKEWQLSSKEYKKLNRFCELFHELFGPVFADEDGDTEQRVSEMRRRRAEGSVTKKKRLWYAVLTVGRNKSGKQTRAWSRGFRTRRAAEHKLAQLLLDGRVAAETRHTLERVVMEYIDHDVTARGRRSPTTTLRYRGLLKNMMPLFTARVDRLDGATLEQFYGTLLEGGLSHTTAHHVHNLLFAAFRWAKSKRIALITHNPFEAGDVEKPRRARSNAQSFTVQQAKTALESLVRTKHRYALVFCLATGCRRGEACGLKWDAVDFDRKIAIIRESRYQITGEHGQKPTKADRIREVPLNDTAMQALLTERARQDQRRHYADDAWLESGHVFTDERGAPLSPMALTNAFARCARKAHLPTTAMHHLRHTAATFILSAGGNPAAAAQILGHSEKSTTLRLYGHVIGLDEVRAVRSIDRALKQSGRQNTEWLFKTDK